jgi:hypothetical protein
LYEIEVSLQVVHERDHIFDHPALHACVEHRCPEVRDILQLDLITIQLQQSTSCPKIVQHDNHTVQLQHLHRQTVTDNGPHDQDKREHQAVEMEARNQSRQQQK